MNKRVTLLLIAVFAVSSLTVVNLALASIPKPSVPEFTLKFVDRSYDVLPTYSIDPYTGENVTHAGYHVNRVTLEMTIKNQPFVPYYDAASGHNFSFSFYYNIRIKGYHSEDWSELYRPSDGYPHHSGDEYTVISLGTLGENGLNIRTSAKSIDVPSGGQVDFQVEAMIGYVSRSGDPPWYPWQFTGETSGWSETQTITIPTIAPSPAPSPEPTPETTPEPTPTPSQEPQQTELTAIIGAAIVVMVLGAGLGLLLYLIKRK